MTKTTITKYTCDFCGFMTIVHGDGIFTANTKEQAREHENNCIYDPRHKKCATCTHRATTHLSNAAVCVLRTNEAENLEKGFFVCVAIGDSCGKWVLNIRPTPWYERKNRRNSNNVEQTAEHTNNNNGGSREKKRG